MRVGDIGCPLLVGLEAELERVDTAAVGLIVGRGGLLHALSEGFLGILDGRHDSDCFVRSVDVSLLYFSLNGYLHGSARYTGVMLGSGVDKSVDKGGR